MKNKTILFFILIITLVLISTLSSASQINRTPKLELCTKEKCYGSNEQIIIKPEEALILKVTIINTDNIWLCYNDIQYHFNLNSNILKDGFVSINGGSSTSNQNLDYFCLSSKGDEEFVTYIPLKDFNTQTSDNKIGKWEITGFELWFNKLNPYSEIPYSSTSHSSYTSYYGYNNQVDKFRGNDLIFDVRKEEPKEPMKG
ncbi:hypothetical protein AUJ10_02110 [Candidatus Pacearchaeota archaeon CG1_02_31_27]|nr:MAG: hypothetical protein AUJ10_02110 [Candidatus Pacearchaeota archaeon CG1_02_31_27]